MNMKTKAQVRMTESIIVLLMFFMIIGFGLIMYGKYYEGEARLALEQRFEQEAIKIASRVVSLPELSCTEGETQEEFCVDLFKAKVFQTELQGRGGEKAFLFYEGELRDSNVNLTLVFPDQPFDASGGKRITLYDNSPDFNEYPNTKIIPSFLPVAIRDYAGQSPQDYVGVLEVTAYLKQK
jgi:hypothetical protein